jgi:predicted hexulose-6-phosphate isomerase
METNIKSDYYLGLYEKSMPDSLSLREKLVATKNAGFNFMEISIDETDEKLERLKWNWYKKQELVKYMWETGTPIMTMCLSGHRKYPMGSEDRSIRRKGFEIMTNAIGFAADTGLKIIQIAGYDEFYRPSNDITKNLFLENLRKSVECAAGHGVILAFETMETKFLNTVGKAMYYVTIINSPYLQIYPDLGNITNAAVLYGKEVSDDLLAGEGHIVALHLKETLPGKFREIPYGTGHVDFQSGVKTVMEMGVRIFLAEMWYTGNKDWEYQLRFANQFIRSKFNVKS